MPGCLKGICIDIIKGCACHGTCAVAAVDTAAAFDGCIVSAVIKGNPIQIIDIKVCVLGFIVGYKVSSCAKV